MQWFRLAIVLALLACGCAAPAAERRAAPLPAEVWSGSLPPDRTRAEIEDLVARINRHRRSLGCGALRWDERLAGVALRHSRDMVERTYFSHVNPDGRDPFDRMRRAGIRFRAAAENLAAGQHTGAETFRGWMDSPGHRRNLEECAYTRVGIGLYRGRWTCVLTRPAASG